MPANKKLLILPGDGVGPEAMRRSARLDDGWRAAASSPSSTSPKDLVGGASIDGRGTPFDDGTTAKVVKPT